MRFLITIFRNKNFEIIYFEIFLHYKMYNKQRLVDIKENVNVKVILDIDIDIKVP